MLTLNDGRSELWQWDTGRTLAVDADCSQVHFSNKVFGRSIDVDVVDGATIIPDVLLQTDKDLNAWAFVGTAENGYTKISKTFKVNRRNKPADYVFTPPDQTTLAELSGRLDRIEESQDPEAIKNVVDDYLAQNPVEVPVKSVNGKTGAVELNAEDVGAIAETELQTAINTALAQAKASGEFDGADGAPGKDGAGGQPGENGADGYSPTANVTQNDNSATITITDKNGTTTATVTNGKDGADGNPGADGSPGKDGADGKSAYQYAVEGGYTGTEAEFAALIASPGAYPVVDMTADTAELEPNTYYRWGEISALTVTLGAEIAGITNEYCFEFVSSETATELTVPIPIKWVQEPSIEAGKTYQVSIMNGIGVICGA